MSSRNQSTWREKLTRCQDNLAYTTWLRDQGSLTARLQARGRFALHLLRQESALPTGDESLVLGIKRSQLAWVREVTLFCDDQAMVFAHTVLAQRPRGPLTRWLNRLGNRSLGALLFSHPGFSRGRLHARRLDHRHPLYAPAIEALQLSPETSTSLWARRSRFVFGKQSVLVTEVFSPAVCPD